MDRSITVSDQCMFRRLYRRLSPPLLHRHCGPLACILTALFTLKIIHANRCLIIPDVHQNIAWVERVFAQEPDHELVVFLGDYFDTYMPPKLRTGVAATCDYLETKRRELGAKAIFLLGNHDIQYLEAKPACDHYRTPRNLHYKCGSAFKHSAASKIAKGLAPEFWQNARLFACVNGWLLSHAGLSPSLWPQRSTITDSLSALNEECQTALLTMKQGAHPLLQAGKSRGGVAAIGGITWLDWDDEFSDDLPLPQIVGHTGSEQGARRKGRSWCVDGHQTSYGMLSHEGLIIKTC